MRDVVERAKRGDHDAFGMLVQMTSDRLYGVHWYLGQGEVTDSFYLVEVGEDLYLFQWLNPTNDPVAEMAVLSTLEFIDAIPN